MAAYQLKSQRSHVNFGSLLPLKIERVPKRLGEFEDSILGQLDNLLTKSIPRNCMQVIRVDHAFDGHSLGLVKRDFAREVTHDSRHFGDADVRAPIDTC
jgi:hypothetical protein